MRGVIGLSFLAVMVVIILALTSHSWDVGAPPCYPEPWTLNPEP